MEISMIKYIKYLSTCQISLELKNNSWSNPFKQTQLSARGRFSNSLFLAPRSSSPFVRVGPLSFSLARTALPTPFPRSGCWANTIRFRNARAILRCPLHPRHCSRSRCVTWHEWSVVSFPRSFRVLTRDHHLLLRHELYPFI